MYIYIYYMYMLHSHPQHLAYLWHKPPESQFPRRWKRSGSDSEANVESLNLCSCQPFYHDSTPHHSSAKDSVRNPMTARLKGISLSLLHWSNPEGQKFPTLSVLRHNIKRSMTGKLTWGCWAGNSGPRPTPQQVAMSVFSRPPHDRFVSSATSAPSSVSRVFVHSLREFYQSMLRPGEFKVQIKALGGFWSLPYSCSPFISPACLSAQRFDSPMGSRQDSPLSGAQGQIWLPHDPLALLTPRQKVGAHGPLTWRCRWDPVPELLLECCGF